MTREEAYAVVEADLRECAAHADSLELYVEEFNDGGPARFSASVTTIVSRPGPEGEYESLLATVDAIKAWRK